MMGLDLETVVAIILLTLLGVFLTGPGMWSEKWGWWALRKRRGGRAGGAQAHDDAADPGVGDRKSRSAQARRRRRMSPH
ncbi:MAG TPA: hypothetical protein VFK85_03715 [Anaeromyxobacteraceae bacterium]|nr:hypothetical protein [Anaeromyxobacteraceae bacterium]